MSMTFDPAILDGFQPNAGEANLLSDSPKFAAVASAKWSGAGQGIHINNEKAGKFTAAVTAGKEISTYNGIA